MSPSIVAGQFVSGTKGPIFVLLRHPVGSSRGCVLVVPALAEEMNKCRRMVTEVAIRLAERGYATLVPDLYGTGDSAGDFADCDWPTWLGDLSVVSRWGGVQGHPVTALLAVRAGCALARSALEEGVLPAVQRSVLWQPVFDGSRFLGQFLRLRIAASLMDDRQETLAELKGRFRSGAAIEVAGYGLSSRLAADLERARMPDRLPTNLGLSAWIEVSREPGAPLSIPTARLIETTRTEGHAVQAIRIAGEPFWASTEVVVNSAIVSATVAHLSPPDQG